MSEATRFALSIDVEDYFQVWAFSEVVSRDDWAGFATRYGDATRRVLELLDRTSSKATFFVLAWAAERDQSLIREIQACGHELGSHGIDHRKAFEQTHEQFFHDVSSSKRTLENIVGAPIIGYRAPGFSLNAQTPWAYECLAEAGYSYSSSSHPISHDHYGDPLAPRTPFHPLSQSGFLEAPVATAEFFDRRISSAGGGWFRAAPYPVFNHILKQAEKTLDGPVIFYFHPWEIDVAQPKIQNAPIKSRIRHYLNLSTMEKKLERLLNSRSWGRIDNALGLHPVCKIPA